MRILTWSLIAFLSLNLYTSASAGPLADEKLLEFLKANGALTEAQVLDIKKILDEERAQEQQELPAGSGSLLVRYDEGLHFETADKQFAATIGGVIQADAVVYGANYPIKNDFDIRRARLFLAGRLYNHFSYKFEAEFEGGSSNRLIDAYINYDYFPAVQFRIGQFKEPFSLEHLISDKYLPFNERSFAYYLTPERDVGLMVHGVLYGDAINYALGIFNGDGRDAERRSQKKDKEYTGRIALKPFSNTGLTLLKGLHLGASYSYARLDTSDFNFTIRTPARTPFFTVRSRAKFNITQQIDTRQRYGLEAAYSLGPVIFMGEFIRSNFRNIALTDTEPFDVYMKSWYAGFLWMLTGEQPVMKGGVLEKIRPRNNFDPQRGTWGAVGLGFRYDKFLAERIVYEHLVFEGYSVRQAHAITAALNWYLNAMMRITFTWTRTKFESPLFLGTHWKGYSYYRSKEHAFITRFQLEF
jgi:phosphate-selective porin OprO and OprP